MASILLLEDSPTVSDPLRSLLENDGHKVAVCQDAASAIAFIDRNETLDLALVDYWLEQGTAETVLTTLHDKRPDVRVVLITGGSRDVSVETTQWLGALDGIDGFLQKPFSRREIQAIIRQFCG
ncbi:response regulator [Paracoccus lutimaris]|uniref:Response regulator receiver domain-containing protein n=1 Tax=Paracoccus lutimaris TaxID=1490030 RepID=A0A368YV70_9RHOB|nr:response regulator [Paracoccus lutimaris]RCW84110.1 response regulator receiver domain-containing protein [Paracoccus lutimaris]